MKEIQASVASNKIGRNHFRTLQVISSLVGGVAGVILALTYSGYRIDYRNSRICGLQVVDAHIQISNSNGTVRQVDIKKAALRQVFCFNIKNFQME